MISTLAPSTVPGLDPASGTVLSVPGAPSLPPQLSSALHRYMWKSEKPLYHSHIDKPVAYKRRGESGFQITGWWGCCGAATKMA